MKKEATIYDIAKELDLSASTVSRALKDNPIINQDTRKKVQKCADQMGYRSNTFASNLRTQRTNTIGVIVPRLDSTFMSSCLAGMEEVANEKGYNILISQSHESIDREAENATMMFNKRVDGVIASLTIEDDLIDHFKCFEDKNVPVVFFDRVPYSSNNACFVIENYRAANTATQHLIDQGCTKLVHVTIDSKSNVYVDRMNGFLAAVEAHPNVEGEVVFINALNLDEGKQIAKEIIAIKPDGIFVANDLTAVGCMLELQEKGMRIPEDIACVGFNNDPVATIIKPELSSVAYPGKEAGMLAAKSLIEHLSGENDITHTNSVILNTRLIVRASSQKS